MSRNSIKGSTVLITGGAGFIGSHLADKIQSEGAKEVILVDNLFIGSEENIEGAVSKGAIFYREDIENKNNLDYIFEKHNVDIVFNCATKALNYSFVNPAEAFSTNTRGVTNILELQRAGKFKTLCHFSTSEVYGTAIYEPMNEDHPRLPTTTYAAGKAAADLAVDSYVKMFDLDAFIIRPFNNYGPRQNYKGLLAGVIPITAWRIFKGEKPQIHGSGTQSRDFIYVEDTVKALIKLFLLVKQGDNVNISSDNCYDINTLIPMICEHYNYTDEIVRQDARGSDVQTHLGCNKKLNSLINFKQTSFDEGLKKTLDWYSSKFS